MEKLATIQRIKEIINIPNADKIELVKLENLEWQIVVQRNLYKVGDFVCYIQIDTIAPEAPWSEFLRDRHFRIKTIRLKKQLSQGLIIPLKDLNLPGGVAPLGDDITSILGVIKYEKPIPANLQGKIKGNFPTKYVPKTDEERLQNVSRILEELQGVPMYITTKVDGSSGTFIYYQDALLTTGETHVCSRNLSLKEPEGEEKNAFWGMEKKYDILNKLKNKGNFAVQGELCGPGVQGNKLGLKEIDLFVFNVYNIDERRYLNYAEFIDFTSELGLKTCPILETNFLLDGKTFDELLKMADGFYENGTLREGIVFRPMIERYSEYMEGRVSFKIVSNAFLEHYKE